MPSSAKTSPAPALSTTQLTVIQGKVRTVKKTFKDTRWAVVEAKIRGQGTYIVKSSNWTVQPDTLEGLRFRARGKLVDTQYGQQIEAVDVQTVDRSSAPKQPRRKPTSPWGGRLCKHCKKPLKVFGLDRKNGVDHHSDWSKRPYHKKCWKVLLLNKN